MLPCHNDSAHGSPVFEKINIKLENGNFGDAGGIVPLSLLSTAGDNPSAATAAPSDAGLNQTDHFQHSMKELPTLPPAMEASYDAVLDHTTGAPNEESEKSWRDSPPREGNVDLMRTKAIAIGQSLPGPKGPTEEVEVIYEAKGLRVDYAAPSGGLGSSRMRRAVQGCTVFVIRRVCTSSKGQTRRRSSIAVISDDGEIRLQQKLNDAIELIPYTTWGNKLDVVLRVPTKLRIYDDIDPKPIAKIDTSWVSYIFAEEEAATGFQNALMGKKLLLSVKTSGTTRTQSGFSGMFSVDERLCAMENLRVWRDGSERGRVFAMIQCSSQFRDGYLAFYINGPYNTAHVTDLGPKRIKIKGLTIPVNGRGILELHTQTPEEFTTRKSRRKKKQMVTGIKIDFDTEEDKAAFLEVFRQVKGPFFG